MIAVVEPEGNDNGVMDSARKPITAYMATEGDEAQDHYPANNIV